jgi:hypothetical protein
MKFHKGTSGSPKHTETIGRDVGGRGPADIGPKIGPGVAATRVRPEIQSQVSSAGARGASSATPKGMDTYRVGSAPPRGYKQ